jgi:hypothetical protein
MESPPHEAGGVTPPQPLKFKLPVYVPVQDDTGDVLGTGVEADCLAALHPHISTDDSRVTQSFFIVFSSASSVRDGN